MKGDASRRRYIVLGAVVIVFVGLLAGGACLQNAGRFTIVPGADMHAETTAQWEALASELPAGADSSWSLRGGFQPHGVLSVVGVTDPDEQDALVDAVRDRRARGIHRYPVVITFYVGVEETTRTTEDGATLTTRHRGDVLREERLE